MTDSELEKMADEAIQASGMWIRDFEWEIRLKLEFFNALRSVRDSVISLPDEHVLQKWFSGIENYPSCEEILNFIRSQIEGKK